MFLIQESMLGKAKGSKGVCHHSPFRNKSLKHFEMVFLGLWAPADLSKYHEIPLFFLRNWNQSHGRLVQLESHSKNQTILVFIQEEIPKIE